MRNYFVKYIKNILTFNSSRERLYLENKNFGKNIPKGSLVLDAGSGSSPYKDIFQHAQYESADFMQVGKEYFKPTYICDLRSIPAESNRFDFIIFNQVMEHLPEPKVVLSELHRVLKPGGKMIYTGPFFYEEHEQPYDFYRYTQFGLKYLFQETGFTVERLDWLEGYFGTAGYQLYGMAKYLPFRRKDIDDGILGYFFAPLMLIMKIAFIILSVLFHRLEMKYKIKTGGYPKNYIAIVICQ